MMRRKGLIVLGLCVMASSGCFDLSKVDPSSIAKPQPLPPITSPPASTETAARVDQLGRKILAANPQIGAKPMFHTIGAPQPEVFHRGTADIFVTEGLVKQCANDGQLAAILTFQLGKMVAEREALTPKSTRDPTRLTPIDPRTWTDAGWTDYPDLTRTRELADFDRQKRQRSQPLPTPDPQALARLYLLRSGFHDEDIAAAQPILAQAGSNSQFEKQMTTPAAPTTPGPY